MRTTTTCAACLSRFFQSIDRSTVQSNTEQEGLDAILIVSHHRAQRECYHVTLFSEIVAIWAQQHNDYGVHTTSEMTSQFSGCTCLIYHELSFIYTYIFWLIDE